MVEPSKVIRLVEYLTRLAQLRTRIIRNVSEFQNVLWIKDIPKQQVSWDIRQLGRWRP